MAERKESVLRLTAIGLAAANLIMLVYLVFAGDDRAAAQRIEQLQINPERIKIIGAASRGPTGAQANPAAMRACLQWGPFAGAALARAEAELASLSLPQAPLQRRLQNERFAYLLREPDAGVIAKLAELQRAYPGTDLRAVPCPL